MRVSDKKKNRNLLFWGLLLLAFLELASTFVMIAREGGIYKGDLKHYWMWSAYQIRGYTSEEAAMGLLPEIGPLGTSGPMPWARLLGNLVSPGFLPWEFSAHWYYLCLACGVVFLIRYILRWLDREAEASDTALKRVIAVSSVLIPWYWFDAVHPGNPGALMGVLAVLSLFLAEEHPNLAAFFLAFSVGKPQVGALFFLVFLLLRHYKVFFRAIGILAASWVAWEIYTPMARNFFGLGPVSVNASQPRDSTWSIILERITSGDAQIAGGGHIQLYYGLFDPLRWLGMPILMVLILSALAGILWVVYWFFRLRRAGEKSLVFCGAAAALASLFWTYKSQGESVVIGLCNMLLVYLVLKEDRELQKTPLPLLISLVLMNCKIVKYFIRFPLGLPHTIGVVGDMVLQIVCFSVFMHLYLKKHGKQDALPDADGKVNAGENDRLGAGISIGEAR